jgi:hypothetical protein
MNEIVNIDDGWTDAAAEAGRNVLRGTLLKFSDSRWTAGREGVPITEGTRLVAVGTAAAWVRWRAGKPVQYIMRQPRQPLPTREELGDTDKNVWEIGPDDKPRDPWQDTRFVHLIDPTTAEAFTFSTSSYGGRGAVSELGDQIARMRMAHPDAVPIVELQSAPMQTRYGRKSKPRLKVVGWRTASGGAAQPIEQRPITAQEAVVEANPYDDEIPF